MCTYFWVEVIEVGQAWIVSNTCQVTHGSFRWIGLTIFEYIYIYWYDSTWYCMFEWCSENVSVCQDVRNISSMIYTRQVAFLGWRLWCGRYRAIGHQTGFLPKNKHGGFVTGRIADQQLWTKDAAILRMLSTTHMEFYVLLCFLLMKTKTTVSIIVLFVLF